MYNSVYIKYTLLNNRPILMTRTAGTHARMKATSTSKGTAIKYWDFYLRIEGTYVIHYYLLRIYVPSFVPSLFEGIKIFD